LGSSFLTPSGLVAPSSRPRHHPTHSFRYPRLAMKLVTLFGFVAALTVTTARPSVFSTDDAEHNATALHRRWDNPHPAVNDDWYRAVCRGRTLLDAVRDTDWQAAHRFKPPPPRMSTLLTQSNRSGFKNFEVILLTSDTSMIAVQSPFRDFPST
jgi:hypothetical protein